MIKKIKFIDLELPSKILWGNRNLENNKYYQWGDLKGYSKSQIESGLKMFDYEHYKFFKKDKLTKYNNSDKLRELLPEDDVVTQTLGNNYRIPRKEDFEELFFYTDKIYTWSSVIFKSKINGNQIIFPLLGFAYFWSSSLLEDDLYYAWRFYITKTNKVAGMYYNSRCFGRLIRPIYDKEK